MDDLTASEPFAAFDPRPVSATPLRASITAACRRAEAECMAPLIAAARVTDEDAAEIAATATRLIEALRANRRTGGIDGLIHEYALSSEEGVALMCLAEALLRIPDTATRDALIRDKISGGDWLVHLGHDRPLFVNAATWGLAITGRLVSTVNAEGLGQALARLIARCGEPVIRRGVDLAMRLLGEQFVIGETIEAALKRAREREARGFAYSYDMLGEAATTAADATRYFRDYEAAIHAIGQASAGRGIYAGPGISIKLSALHPRYVRAKAGRVQAELLPAVKALAVLAKSYDIGLNIDAEEADRLELSLDLIEALALDRDLAGWNGLGFVVQAYGKRCPFVLDFLIDLAGRAGRRLMVRLVKGAYWDSEIKRAQVDGLADFPVFTRKSHTDVCYIASARKMLAARGAIFPQFATHNAQTLATIHHLAGPDFTIGDYEFQCLHGMGEPLYDQVVGKARLDRPARIYAPVGTHETLLAYLVRRLLENGANSSFVNRIADPRVPVAALTADPAALVAGHAAPGAPNTQIALPADLFSPERRNSAGCDLSSDSVLSALTLELQASASFDWTAAPPSSRPGRPAREVRNPGRLGERVGTVIEPDETDIAEAMARAVTVAASWAATPVAVRAAALEKTADLFEAALPRLIGLIMREAGKTLANAVGEVREAVDFLRYYAAEARRTLDPSYAPLGPIVCISPWNFPLAIFTGQIAAALAAGNPVLAKPAEETPLIAAEAVRLMQLAGIPLEAVQLLPGDGGTGARLVAHSATAGVMFTGSTEVARAIALELAKRLSADGRPIPLIAETGGQNAMIVDSSALAEQVVGDVLASAFDSAGQRCSALRILCLQEEIAERTLAMLKGAMAELTVGPTDRLATDVGPVISREARDRLDAHIAAMRAQGAKVTKIELPMEAAGGLFVPPTIIEIESISQLKAEQFGPILHVLRYARTDRDRLIEEINATGYGLTFGLHTRLDETIAEVSARVRVGNFYINRNMIGAVVGCQPFGGRALSGTGPKAGGPLYLGRLVKRAPQAVERGDNALPPAFLAFADWCRATGRSEFDDHLHAVAAASLFGHRTELPGPVGERNLYALNGRGRILLLPLTAGGLLHQLAAVLATGNSAIVDAEAAVVAELDRLPQPVRDAIFRTDDWTGLPLAGALIEGGPDRVLALQARIAALPGPVVPVQAAGEHGYNLSLLLEEVSTSINTTAAGGNASLMTQDDSDFAIGS